MRVTKLEILAESSITYSLLSDLTTCATLSLHTISDYPILEPVGSVKIPHIFIIGEILEQGTWKNDFNPTTYELGPPNGGRIS